VCAFMLYSGQAAMFAKGRGFQSTRPWIQGLGILSVEISLQALFLFSAVGMTDMHAWCTETCLQGLWNETIAEDTQGPQLSALCHYSFVGKWLAKGCIGVK
jgi:hypothetical protein